MTSLNSQMHNDIMAAGYKERPLMLAPRGNGQKSGKNGLGGNGQKSGKNGLGGNGQKSGENGLGENGQKSSENG
ncbi:hypothetical protein Tco_0575307 [Tanacetum coccineum]